MNLNLSLNIKILLILSVFSALSLTWNYSYAEVINPPANNVNGVTNSPANQTTGAATLTNPLSPKINSLGAAVNTGLQVFTYIVILFSVLMFIWVGLQFILARGNSDRLKELKSHLFNLIIGVAIVIGARVIIQVVINTLGSTGLVNQQIIRSANQANGQ